MDPSASGTWTARGVDRPTRRSTRLERRGPVGFVLASTLVTLAIGPAVVLASLTVQAPLGTAVPTGAHAAADPDPPLRSPQIPTEPRVDNRPTRQARAAAVTASQRERILRADLVPGDEGPDVAVLQRHLRSLGFDPGPDDGVYDTRTTYAVWAFQKLNGREPDGTVTIDVWRDLAFPRPLSPLVADGDPDRVEIDLDRQVLVLYRGGEVQLITHVSTGSGRTFCEAGPCRAAVTPTGDYAFTWRASGWRRSPLGLLYEPVYFNGGIAVHGATSVPTHPASHGCVRIPMHIAEYFPSLVERGDPVHVVSRA